MEPCPFKWHERDDGLDVVFVKIPKRPGPEATFAQAWEPEHKKLMARPDITPGYIFREMNLREVKALARRAWNAGRRSAAKKERN